MRIKKLEIVGFKSFCDRTVLSFDSPITGIVVLVNPPETYVAVR